MSIPLIVNGVTFSYPQQFDKSWGPTLTTWSQAVTNGMLQKAGGSFTLTAETDFGASFGLKALYLKSEDANIASTGFLRLANATTGLVWRNSANNADLALTVNSSNQLTFNGTNVGATTSLTNGHILVGNASNQPADAVMSGDITITNAGVTAIGAGKVLDANVGSGAAIALTKLASTTAYYWHVANVSGVLVPLPVTASRAVATDTNGSPVASATTATELGYLSGVGSALQTQINGLLPKTGGTMSGSINMSANKITALTQGSSTGEAIAYPVGTSQISNGAITTALLASGAVTQIVTGTTSVTLTTAAGSSVLVFAQADSQGTTAAGVASFNGYDTAWSITRDSINTIYSGRAAAGGFSTLGKTVIIPFNGTALDAPSAGSHTYAMAVNSGTSGFSLFTTSIFAIEIKR